jgi:hypothetical protein
VGSESGGGVSAIFSGFLVQAAASPANSVAATIVRVERAALRASPSWRIRFGD